MNRNIQKNICNPINVLRVIAFFIVFILHSLIFTSMTGLNIYDKADKYPWVFLLKTPAWAGVWIFLALGGYLAAKSFLLGRYEYNIKGFTKYYIKKIKRIAIPYYVFCILVSTFTFPNFLYENPQVVKQILFFNYNGIPGVDGYGALWYVSTVMQLYLIVPFVSLLFNYTLGLLYKKNSVLGRGVSFGVLILIIVLGYLNRSHLLNTGADWYSKVYVNSLSNLDLFIGGMALAYVIKDNPIAKFKCVWRTVIKILAAIMLLATIVVCCRLYFIGDVFEPNALITYKYKFQTVFLISVCCYLFAFDYKRTYTVEPLTLKTTIRNPLRILDFFSNISFEMYMFHSLILCKIWSFVGVNLGNGLTRHFAIIFVSFAVTVLFSYLYSKAFAPNKKPKISKSTVNDINIK